jgi:hypothetical protein
VLYGSTTVVQNYDAGRRQSFTVAILVVELARKALFTISFLAWAGVRFLFLERIAATNPATTRVGERESVQPNLENKAQLSTFIHQIETYGDWPCLFRLWCYNTDSC